MFNNGYSGLKRLLKKGFSFIGHDVLIFEDKGIKTYVFVIGWSVLHVINCVACVFERCDN